MSHCQKLYQHVNCTDTAVEVLDESYSKEKNAHSFTVEWWNTGFCHDPWPLGIVTSFEVAREVWLRDWRVYARAPSGLPARIQPVLR